MTCFAAAAADENMLSFLFLLLAVGASIIFLRGCQLPPCPLELLFLLLMVAEGWSVSVGSQLGGMIRHSSPLWNDRTVRMDGLSSFLFLAFPKWEDSFCVMV